jgi:predicted phage terminase large subunit-like protein
LIRDLVRDPICVVTRGASYENRGNLAPAFFDQIIRKYEGTRLGRQELEAELLEDTPGALWSHGSIEASRLRSTPEMTRVVVAIDPAVTSGEEADETGIVVAGKDKNGHGYVLADISGRYSPIEWARLAITAYATHRADRIVAEVNNGGDMVGATLRMVDPNVAFTAVRASRGKVVRAEPVAALYQQGRVHHIGTFPQLEDQMTNFTSDIDRAAAGYSPDRVDALVWAFSDLLVEPMSNEGFYFWAKEKAASLQPKPAPRPEPIYAIGSQEYAAQQERLKLQRLEQGEDEDE